MKQILKQLETRVVILKKAISKAERDQRTYPEGNLRVSVGNNRVRYYHVVQKGDTQGDYIPKENRKLAAALAQKDYNKHFLKAARCELSRIEKIMAWLSNDNADAVYDNLSENRRILVSPYIITDDAFAKMWQDTLFKPNPYRPEYRVYDTRRGEKVRSKSEAIIADILYDLGIPYHYEKPIRLVNGKLRYPDFTLLQKIKREEIYLEHFGLLDDEEYRNSSLIKLDEYRNCGIYPGKNLLFTYETRSTPLDIKGIRDMLKDVMN